MSSPWRPWPCTQDGEESVGLTAAEFKVLMAKLIAEAEACIPRMPAAFPLGRIIISCDNASAHCEFQRERPDADLNTIPPHSPDIHKVVEHPLGPFNKAWYKEFSMDRKCTTCESSMALASRILRRHSAAAIHKDIKTLPATLQAIVNAGGDWAPPALR